MTDQHSIEAFSENLRQDVLGLAEFEQEGMMLADAFTQIAFDMLSEAGEFEDPLVCYHRTRGMEVSGYQVDEDEGRLDIFPQYPHQRRPRGDGLQAAGDVAFRRLHSFLEWCLSGRFADIEESSPVFDMATHIHGFRNSLAQIRLCVITDGRTTVDTLPQGPARRRAHHLLTLGCREAPPAQHVGPGRGSRSPSTFGPVSEHRCRVFRPIPPGRGTARF